MLLLTACCASPAAEPDSVSISWRANAGTPLRVYITNRLPKRLGEPVHAILIEPVYSFNHEVIPAGAVLTGSVTKLTPVTKAQRTAAILGGDFTPLHHAEVQFTSAKLSDGHEIPLHTIPTAGLTSIYDPRKAPPAPAASKGTLQQAKSQIANRVTSRANGVVGMVRGPDKLERFGDFFLMKLPYHPQWVRRRTRFDALLSDPIDFGAGQINPADLTQLGTQPSDDTIVHARLLVSTSSATAKLADRIEAVVSQPLFSSDEKLVLPEGTKLTGSVTRAQPARWFHRGGQLRFVFDHATLPEGAQALLTSRPLTLTLRSRAVLNGAESSGSQSLKVDPEGNAKTVESGTRFILPAVAAVIAIRGGHDFDHQEVNGVSTNHPGRRILGGGLGFGLLGIIASRTSRLTGVAFGYYGLASSVFRNILARGADVEFEKDAATDIRFGASATRPAAAQ